MAETKIGKKALALLNEFELAGRAVSRVIIHGQKVELELSQGPEFDEFDKVDMRHDQA